MTEIHDFVRARLAETREVLDRVVQAEPMRWSTDSGPVVWGEKGVLYKRSMLMLDVANGVDHSVAEYVALMDPWRGRLMAVQLSRVLGWHDGSHECNDEQDNCSLIDVSETCDTVRALAAIWFEHDDWQGAWEVGGRR